MRIDPNLALSESGFLFHASTGDSYSVNPTGLHIIQLIRQGKRQSEILRSLTEEYQVGEERAEEDLHDFLQYLRQLKLLING